MAVASPSGPEAQSTQAASADASRGLLEKIEDFCSRPGFTDSISDFASQHSSEFASGSNEGEQPVSRRPSRTAATTITLTRTPSCLTAPDRRLCHTPPPHTAATPLVLWYGIPPLSCLARPLSCLTCNSFDGTRSTCSTPIS